MRHSVAKLEHVEGGGCVGKPCEIQGTDGTGNAYPQQTYRTETITGGTGRTGGNQFQHSEQD